MKKKYSNFRKNRQLLVQVLRLRFLKLVMYRAEEWHASEREVERIYH